MTLAPLIAAPFAIKLHVAAALVATVLGAFQIALPKGGPRHRAVGGCFVVVMGIVAISSFFIHTICQLGGFSLLHLLSIFTLVMLPFGVIAARSGNIRVHARRMVSIYIFALVLAGSLTLLPGRILHDVVFETALSSDLCPVK